MTICEKCEDRSCEKTGKPCKELNKQLRGQGIYSEDYPMKYDSKIIIRESRLPEGKIFEGHLYNKKKEEKSIKKIALENRLRNIMQEGLTDNQYAVLNLFYFEGYSWKEISKELKISTKRVELILYKARHKLQKLIIMS